MLAFGIDNESGDGRISYSKTARKRFIAWLKNKYSTLDNLNKAWATQRWSRRINIFEEIGFPVATHTTDVPERMLDFRRFVSDEINQLLLKVINKVSINAPNALVNTNAWYYSQMKYFDYSQIAYSGKMTREGCGFYPGLSLKTNSGVIDPKGAEIPGSITSLDKDYPIITPNKYGKGRAIYVGLPANKDELNPLLDEVINDLGIKKGPNVPSGIMARQIDGNHFLYLNVTGGPKEIPMKGKSTSILFNKNYTGNFNIAPYEAEFIEVKKMPRINTQPKGRNR